MNPSNKPKDSSLASGGIPSLYFTLQWKGSVATCSGSGTQELPREQWTSCGKGWKYAANSHGNACGAFTRCEKDAPWKESVILSFKGKSIREGYQKFPEPKRVYANQWGFLINCVFFLMHNSVVQGMVWINIAMLEAKTPGNIWIWRWMLGLNFFRINWLPEFSYISM